MFIQLSKCNQQSIEAASRRFFCAALITLSSHHEIEFLILPFKVHAFTSLHVCSYVSLTHARLGYLEPLLHDYLLLIFVPTVLPYLVPLFKYKFLCDRRRRVSILNIRGSRNFLSWMNLLSAGTCWSVLDTTGCSRSCFRNFITAGQVALSPGAEQCAESGRYGTSIRPGIISKECGYNSYKDLIQSSDYSKVHLLALLPINEITFFTWLLLCTRM